MESTSTAAAATAPRSAMVVLALAVLIGANLLVIGPGDYPDLHTILDTALALLAGMLAMLFWDMGGHTGRPFPKWLAVAFTMTCVLNLVHVLVTVEWSGSLAPIARLNGVLRPATWPPSTHLLPIGVGAALWQLRRGASRVLPFAIVIATLGVALFAVFQLAPTYRPPGFLGVTRPTLVASPFLWAAVFVLAGRMRAAEPLATAIAWTAATLIVANVAMLYSRAPADGPAMVAHLGRVAGHLVLFLFAMQMASRSMRDRMLAEARLARLNEDLDRRVVERTEELASANTALENEIAVRRRAEEKTLAQVERLNLLHQITRAIGDRQDLDSIFQVAVGSVERQLPADFACLCYYDDLDRTLTVRAVGANSHALAMALGLSERAQVGIDENGLSQCVRGALVYEADIAEVEFPFPQRLAGGGLGSMVAAPLQVESKVFGVLVVARRAADAFASGECEFLRQLSEHVALAAHQAQLHAALQAAYDDLRQSQQAVLQQERLRALGQMASGIAHDINNALSPVALYTESMLETETRLSETARGQLEIIRRAVEDVSQTIARMREFYRQREPQLTTEPVNLNELVTQVLDLTRARWSDMAMQRGVVVEVRPVLDTKLPLAAGVESEIREALINLVFNAIDAMPEGGVLTVRTTAQKPGMAKVEVVDNGVGMDAEARRRCLEPFFTTKGDRGTGLGLAMVYGVVQRHAAELDIQSAPGEGTTVALAFAGVDGHDRGRAAEAAETPLPRLRLLLVDDDPVLLKALADALGADGHLVTTANDGRVGIDVFEVEHGRTPFDLVVTDLGMPYIDGRQVAAAVKTLSPATPVILLTGWGQGLLSGAEVPPHIDLVLAKPPKLRELRAGLASLHRGAAVR